MTTPGPAGMTPPPAAGADMDADWWRGAVIYEIYPRSFRDSDGDGIGDLAGIVAALDYIAALGVDAIWIAPIFPSPMLDFGYDVTDYFDIDPMFGALADLDRLVAEARRRHLRILLDLAISHTSDRHPWFQESRASRANPKADWYVWAAAKADGTPPNNWLSVFGGPAWEWEPRRGQYFLHNFLTAQPDLNFHHPAVQDAVLGVARFWLERGISGFRLDTVNFYFHDRTLGDNPPLAPGERAVTVPSINPYGRQRHVHDKNQPENLAFLERLRRVMDEYPGTASVGELGTDHDVHALSAAYTEAGKRLHMTYSFDLLGQDLSALHIRRSVAAMLAEIGSGWPCWSFSNHDVERIATRWRGGDPALVAPVLIALLVSLRGSACLYQGEELGLTEAEVAFEQLRDPYGKRFWPQYKGRDGCRTPMPWSDVEPGAGFSSGPPWLPIPPEHRRLAVSRQLAQPNSTLNRTRRFLHWRKGMRALLRGDLAFLEAPEPALAFIRSTAESHVLCVFNPAPTEIVLPLPDGAAVVTLSGHGFGGSAVAEGIRVPAFDAFFGELPGHAAAPRPPSG